MQLGREREARALMDDVLSTTKLNVDHFAGAFALAAIPARYTLERRQWAEAAELSSFRRISRGTSSPRPNPSRGSPGASGLRAAATSRRAKKDLERIEPLARRADPGQEHLLGASRARSSGSRWRPGSRGPRAETRRRLAHAAVGRQRGRHREASGDSRRALPRAGDAGRMLLELGQAGGRPRRDRALSEERPEPVPRSVGRRACLRARRQPRKGSAVLRAAPGPAKAADGERTEIKQAKAFK